MINQGKKSIKERTYGASEIELPGKGYFIERLKAAKTRFDF